MTDSINTNFYEDLFIKNSAYTNKYPNIGEARRAGFILSIMAEIAGGYYQQNTAPLQIIDAGCGRGWLTNLLSLYGDARGFEPVAEVVAHAKQLFPQIQFDATTPQEYRQSKHFIPCDIVVCSEVIEHVPYAEQSAFMESLGSLLNSNGNIILTTPRGDVQKIWDKHATQRQPIEDWLTDDQLKTLAEICGYRVRKHITFGESYLPSSYFHRGVLRKVQKFLSAGQYSSGFKDVYQLIWLEKKQ